MILHAAGDSVAKSQEPPADEANKNTAPESASAANKLG